MSNWWDYYITQGTENSKKPLFDISLEDLKKWGAIFGDDSTKKTIDGWGDQTALQLWKNKNSGMSTIFNAFTNWVKSNGGEHNRSLQESQEAFTAPNSPYNISNGALMTHSGYTKDGKSVARTWAFNGPNPTSAVSLGSVNATEGTVDPYTRVSDPSLFTSDIKPNLSTTLNNVTVETPRRKATRADVRRMLRDTYGVNPYSVSAGQRRAIRQMLNDGVYFQKPESVAVRSTPATPRTAVNPDVLPGQATPDARSASVPTMLVTETTRPEAPTFTESELWGKRGRLFRNGGQLIKRNKFIK